MTARTLPTDSAARKGFALFEGCLKYIPAALAGFSRWSKIGNDKHNPGEPMHHARGKSMDHRDCIVRHLMDLADLEAQMERGQYEAGSEPANHLDAAILDEVDALFWRAGILSQELHEKYGGAPLAPGARLPVPERAPPEVYAAVAAAGFAPKAHVYPERKACGRSVAATARRSAKRKAKAKRIR